MTTIQKSARLRPERDTSSPYSPSNPLIIAVANLKGGVAKTTTAVHIAEYLRQFGTTVLVDGDPNRSAIAWAGRGVRSESDSLHVITEMEMPRYAQKGCHYVFDTKARPDADDIRAMVRAARLIILPTPPSGDDLRVTAHLATLLSEAGSTTHKVLLTRVPDRGRETAVVESQRFFQLQNIPIFKSYIRQYEAYKQAFVQGVPVNAVKNAKSKAAWTDCSQLAEELLATVAAGE